MSYHEIIISVCAPGVIEFLYFSKIQKILEPNFFSLYWGYNYIISPLNL